MQVTSTAPVAVITGAGTGFGRLAAEALARDGYRTYAALRDPAGRNAAVARELEAQGLRVVDLDVTDDASVDAAARTILEEAGAVDVLVNNAGAAYFGLTEAFTPDLVRRQFEVNVFGVLRVNRAFLPAMRKRHSGLVVYVSSVIGRFVIPFAGVYLASKHAIEALAETSAYELRPFGVDVTIVEPSAFKTSIFDKQQYADDSERAATYGAFADKPAELAESMVARAGNPQLVADAIVEIARRPAGTRPLRRIVGDASSAGPINAAVAPIQRAILEKFGMDALAPAVPYEDAALEPVG
ncbi:MAG TPA: SDR family oxidoreductase [Candidatus Elarobacter sp.]|jgi:NAD(P)-dependent dehydrogenase (short-subunit alcohol dehydrogenase family)|nr:SDR family oxidoreductase [Candidatus Elarobacter sp.]